MDMRRDEQPRVWREVVEAGGSLHTELRLAERQLDLVRAQCQAEWEQVLLLRRESESLRRRVDGMQEQLDAARTSVERREQVVEQRMQQAESVQRRATTLTHSLKPIHEALFGGRVHDHILRACLALTGATRGAYVAAVPGSAPRIRAQVGMPQDGDGGPSPFLRALVERAQRTHDAFVCNDGVGPDDLPAPSEAERFRNYAVAPIVLLRDLDGVLVVADKCEGRIDERDMELLLSVGDQASVAVQNARLRRELESAYLSTVTLLADAAEAKDAYTHGHCETVSRYARRIAETMKLDEHETRLTCYAALLHDIGKIGVSDGILHKPGPLLPEEMELMRSHVRVGYDLLRSVPALADVADVVLRHHEWYDGRGYPGGLSGDDIPKAARIVAVVDAYCAMVDRRAYKDARTDEDARAELRRCAGTQFDPDVVETFVRLLDGPTPADMDADHDAACGLPPMVVAPKEPAPAS